MHKYCPSALNTMDRLEQERKNQISAMDFQCLSMPEIAEYCEQAPAVELNCIEKACYINMAVSKKAERSEDCGMQ